MQRFLIPWICLPVLAYQPGPTSSAEKKAPDLLQLLTNFEKAYVNRDLRSLQHSNNRQFKVTVQHSLIEPPAGIETKVFSSFGELETWLRSKEHGGESPDSDLLPVRKVRARVSLQKGIAIYDNMGIQHNHLYLSRVHAALHGGAYHITEIVLYYGD